MNVTPINAMKSGQSRDSKPQEMPLHTNANMLKHPV